MKATCLAAAMTVVLFLLVTLVFRLRPSPRRTRQMALVYLACLGVLALAWYLAPADLGFLPPQLIAEPPWLDCAATLFFFSAAFFGGVLQLYNLADRGFSLRILIDLMESRAAAPDAGELMESYSRGRGTSWMYRKRMDDLVAGGFVRRSEGLIALTPRGASLSALFITIRRFVRLDSIP